MYFLTTLRLVLFSTAHMSTFIATSHVATQQMQNAKDLISPWLCGQLKCQKLYRLNVKESFLDIVTLLFFMRYVLQSNNFPLHVLKC